MYFVALYINHYYFEECTRGVAGLTPFCFFAEAERGGGTAPDEEDPGQAPAEMCKLFPKTFHIKTFDPAFLSACVAGSRKVIRLEAEKYVPDRLWYCPSSAAKPVIESKYQLRPGQVDLHLLVGS